ncbi:SDR family oxidoreductase [Kribbia dieselivorans]|uniref:SDR family oxidoreductase n=1 Tax=Kribbia dieselivorans TaxID=331526 RepID=UPI000838B2DF|nr:SDR family oxidoreductase [Kribbia dieselivorans]
MARFTGRTAIVTGASRGIGLSIAQRLVDEGARVLITARKVPALEEAVAALGGPEKAIFAAGSSDDAAHQDEAIAKAIETFGPIDVLINNTGINPVYGSMMDLDDTAARKIFEVNVLANLAWTRKVLASGMRERGGSIVNIASIAGILPSPGIGFYGVTKAAVIRLTQELAVELGPNIRVNAVAPAVVKTRFATALYEDQEEQLAATYPLKRLGIPEDIASVAAFLASDDAAWMTGQSLVVDGGVTQTGGI